MVGSVTKLVAERVSLREMVAVYYEYNLAGGNLHIALDDGNMESGHLLFCMGQCVGEGDVWGMMICNRLLDMGLDDREEFYDEYWR